jgi:hypothetical protein
MREPEPPHSNAPPLQPSGHDLSLTRLLGSPELARTSRAMLQTCDMLFRDRAYIPYIQHTGISSSLISLYIVQPPVPCCERLKAL